jgi:hypothetical protein
MTLIKVRKAPKSAYNPKRGASALLQAQIAHLEHAVGVPARKRAKRWTEGDAARYIGQLTGRLLAPRHQDTPAGAGEPPQATAGRPPRPARSRMARPKRKTGKGKRSR